MKQCASFQLLFLFCLCRSGNGSIRGFARESSGGSSRTLMRLLKPLKALKALKPRLPAQAVEAGASQAAGAQAQKAPPQLVEESAMDGPTQGGFAGLFDGMRFTVVRIQAIVGKVDWLQPYKQPADSPFVGSGFVVDTGNGDEDPVFLTNAHVVQDARVVQVQLPALGQMIFDAYVPLICNRFDLAVVQLKDPAAFREAMALHNGTMHALHVRPSKVSLGLEVAAVGFPLGSSSLKLSRGIISGTEMVDNTICYQSTAPISPGSSGGPLFAVSSEKTNLGEAEDLEVIGVNFASSSSEGAQNVNYVVPTIHLLQVLHEFHQLKASGAASTAGNKKQAMQMAEVGGERRIHLRSGTQHHKGAPLHKKISETQVKTPAATQQLMSEKKYPHVQLRIAPIDAIGIEASDALYNTSGGCQKGVFLSRILPTSALRFAEPAVPERSFLTAVDNVTIDSFGMGRTANFLGDPTPFESLMLLRERLDDMVTLSICKNGKESKHVVSIRWRPEFDVAVKDIEEPHFEDSSTEFEIFAGVTIMQMTSNHIVELLRSGRPQTLSRWLLIENQEEPRLVITNVEEGTYASRVLTSGMVLYQVNGHNVSTLAELRANFEPPGIAWTLETDRGLLFSVHYKETLIDQVTTAASSTALHYLLSECTTKAAKKLKLVSDTGLLQYDTVALAATVAKAGTTDKHVPTPTRPKARLLGRQASVLLQVSQQLSDVMLSEDQCPVEDL